LRSWALVFLIVIAEVTIALIPQLNQHGNGDATDPTENVSMYEKSIDVLLMFLIGFGFLMAFVRKNRYSFITTIFFMVALSLPSKCFFDLSFGVPPPL
jgi:hypothetical protein